MSVADEIEKLLATSEPPELGPGPRSGVQTEGALKRALGEVFGRANLSSEMEQLIRALILLWHDHLDSAHVIAQEIENTDGAFVHGIMHRREPDYGNAKYWFRRVGQHGAFSEIAKRASQMLESKAGPKLRERLIRNGAWDAIAFIDFCEEANRRPVSDGEQRLLREVQAIETRVLLERFLGGAEA